MVITRNPILPTNCRCNSPEFRRNICPSDRSRRPPRRRQHGMGRGCPVRRKFSRAQFFQGFLVSFGEKHRVWEVKKTFKTVKTWILSQLLGVDKPDCQAVSAYFSRFALYINRFRNWKDPNMDVCQIMNMISHLWDQNSTPYPFVDPNTWQYSQCHIGYISIFLCPFLLFWCYFFMNNI